MMSMLLVIELRFNSIPKDLLNYQYVSGVLGTERSHPLSWCTDSTMSISMQINHLISKLTVSSENIIWWFRRHLNFSA